MDKDTIGALFLICFGLWIAIRCKASAKKAREVAHALGGSGYPEKVIGISFMIGGILFVLFGILVLCGVIEFGRR